MVSFANLEGDNHMIVEASPIIV